LQYYWYPALTIPNRIEPQIENLKLETLREIRNNPERNRWELGAGSWELGAGSLELGFAFS
jgi:hypothetical protein